MDWAPNGALTAKEAETVATLSISIADNRLTNQIIIWWDCTSHVSLETQRARNQDFRVKKVVELGCTFLARDT